MSDMTGAATSVQKLAVDVSQCDRIFVRDLVLDCELGVYAEEKGVTQKVGFSITAAVSPDASSITDEISEVPSYDDLIKLVKSIMSDGHINLVETIAERIAARALEEKRILAVRVRIEKLERGPAAVGVEIVRPRGATL